MSTKTNPWDWDLRVRERNLRAGVLNEKDVEKALGGLTDLGDQVESFSLPQPALDEPEVDEDDADDDASSDDVNAAADAG